MKTIFALIISISTVFAHPPESHVPSTHKHIEDGTILGHGKHKYAVKSSWAKTSQAEAPCINSHAITEGNDGLLYMVTDHPDSDFLVFKKDGTYLRTISVGLGDGHGVEMITHEGTEYLIHIGAGWEMRGDALFKVLKSHDGRVTILKKDGTIVRKFKTPSEMGIEAAGAGFKPTDAAVTPNNTILIINGYKDDLVYEYDFEGHLIRRWGGRTEDASTINNGHGISIDTSDPENPIVWISSRSENKIKGFTLEGKYLETIDLPGAYAGQLFIRGDKMYTAVCWSKDKISGKKTNKSGFVIILDRKTRKVISAPGGSEPIYKDGKLQPLYKTEDLLIHGHDLYVDSEGAIYVGEWNAERRYPTKLIPIKG